MASILVGGMHKDVREVGEEVGDMTKFLKTLVIVSKLCDARRRAAGLTVVTALWVAVSALIESRSIFRTSLRPSWAGCQLILKVVLEVELERKRRKERADGYVEPGPGSVREKTKHEGSKRMAKADRGWRGKGGSREELEV